MNPMTPEQVGTCYTHDKILFRDRKTARMHARRTKSHGARSGRLNAFRCEAHPGFWHLGNLPHAVVRGKLSRDSLNNPPAS